MERVSRAEAARKLGVDRATVTRWCKKHPALLDGNGQVSVDELEQHRRDVIDPALQTKKPKATASAPKGKPVEASNSLNDTRARTESARATGAELDLAERLGLTLARRDVEAALSEATQVIRQRSAQIVRDRAEALSRIEDPRAMETALEDLMRDFLTTAARELALAARNTTVDQDAA